MGHVHPSSRFEVLPSSAPFDFPARDVRQRRAGLILLFGIVVILLALGGRLIHINTALAPRLLSLARHQQFSASTVPARRGMIFDSRGRVLALSRQEPDVFIDAVLLAGRADFHMGVEQLARALSPRLNRPAEQIAAAVLRRPHSRFVVVARHADEITAEAVRDLSHPAVGLSDTLRRRYPMSASLAQVLGWVGADGVGLEGLELAFDAHLRGCDGRLSTLRDARRRAMGIAEESSRAVFDGGHVVLTLDAEVQRIVEEALAWGTSTFEAESGVAIVMAPQTGAVLAMANWPPFDPNEPVSAQSEWVRRNRAVTDPVEPGSSFKPFIACGALDRRHITTAEKIDCRNGSLRFGRRLLTDTHPKGMLDLRGIIAHSSNIGMAQLGQRMGNQALYETVRRFGFGRKTGVACPGESAGVVRPLDQWDSYSTTSIPIGYEILVTPLQLVTSLSAIVNDGILLKPRVVEALLTADGQVAQSFETPQIVGRAVSREVARYLARDVLVAVVTEGGGHRAKVAGYRVLGKTGTAKLLNADRSGYEPNAYLAVFVGAAPVSNPALAAVVMIRRPNPKKGYFGGVVAAPIVAEIFQHALPYLGVPKDEE